MTDGSTRVATPSNSALIRSRERSAVIRALPFGRLLTARSLSRGEKTLVKSALLPRCSAIEQVMLQRGQKM